MSNVFYCPRTNTLLDFVGPDGRSQVYHQTLEELAEREGEEVLIMDEDEAWNLHQKFYKHPPMEISEDYFLEMLEVLPPCRWTRKGSYESFHVSEMLTGAIGSIFVRIHETYFEMHDDIKLTHDQRIEACLPLYHKDRSYMPHVVSPSEQVKLLTIQGRSTGIGYDYNAIPTCTQYWSDFDWVRFINSRGFWYAIEEH